MTRQEFNQLSPEDQLSYCKQVAIQFLDECVDTNRGSAILAKDLFGYFESYCESVDQYFVTVTIHGHTDWLNRITKRHIEKRDGKAVDLGWFVYEEFVEEGFHEMLKNVRCKLTDKMTDPNDSTFITVDYNPHTKSATIETVDK